VVPELSVVLILGEQRDRGRRSLQRLLGQTALPRIEIVVADVTERDEPLPEAGHPSVRWLHCPEFRYYCEAQAELVRQARAPLIAFIEDHCYASPQWAEAILEAFQRQDVVAVNYAFTSANPDSYLSRAILLAEYGHWMTPHPGGPIGISSSTNIAYRRRLLLDQMADNPDIFEAEFLIHRRIQRTGGVIWLAPRALVAHESWAQLGDCCRANGANKRILGARRASHGKWSLPRRVLYGAAMALAPPLYLWRLASAFRTRPALWPLYVTSLPVTFITYVWCAWSEALGYLFGAGGSREEFRKTELMVSRDV